jgi:hypothetical protein
MAPMVCAAVTVTVQLPVPGHPVDQPVNVEPFAAVAVRLTAVPWLKLNEHAPLGQLIPTGLLRTLPVPLPLKVTVSGYVRTKVAVTVWAEFMGTVQFPVPEHAAALQPAKADPELAVAVSVTDDPLE